ncbi:histidine kinase dimerization/phospho-acceptor domain-containing protein [Paenibacillus sp. TAB 01]|uniref:histidine kinase dimerization/phospho-acceptor domain-containing protein n=1 Tax=Paenibacillus sp. TAB 01 TaxID=3368988 RepID=UPI003753D739
MHLSRSRISLIYVSLIIFLLAAVSISSYVASTHVEAELNSVVKEVIPLSEVAENILADTVNMETGVRGLELTNDNRFLEPYDLGKAQLTSDLNEMAAYQQMYPSLKSLMEGDILPQIKRLDAFYTTQISLLRSGQLEEARKRSDSGKALMDRFRQLHLKIRTEIEVITSEAYNKASLSGQRTRIIIGTGGALAILIGGLAIFIFRRANDAESALRKSEETYRFMAESLEAQNEEIIAQQEEQEQTLEKLSQREHELEAISNYQEKLTGSLDMHAFLNAAIPALLASLQLDAALLAVKAAPPDEASQAAPAAFEVLYASGYPAELPQRLEQALYGPALRVFTEKQPIECRRDLSPSERSLHQLDAAVLDQYFPLFDDHQEVIGFLLLTGYLTTQNEQRQRVAKGLARQFSLAFLAQHINEERLHQSYRLAELNEQLTKEKMLIGNILEATHEGMMYCDLSGVIQFTNHRMNEKFRLSRHVGENWLELCSVIEQRNPSFLPVRQSIASLLQDSLDQLNERFTLIGEDEQLHFIELYATKVRSSDAGEQGYLFVFRDRTEEEKADEMKNEFISIVSHELRTPLASVLGFIEILLHRELSPDKQQRYLQTIYKEANRLSALINDFLDLQRMESGKQAYHFAPVEMTQVVREVADQWREKQSHDIRLFAPNDDLWVRADVDRLKQVVHNLLSNAIKYSPQSNQVDVFIDRVGTDRIALKVKDYGLGIPEEAKDKLFTKFYRVDNSTAVRSAVPDWVLRSSEKLSRRTTEPSLSNPLWAQAPRSRLN